MTDVMPAGTISRSTQIKDDFCNSYIRTVLTLSNSRDIKQFTLLGLICTFPSAESVMFPQYYSIILLAACLSFLNVNHVHTRPVSKDDASLGTASGLDSGSTQCVNCTLCEYPCHQNQPSPPQGYPNYGAPPPPPPVPPVAGPSARAPPPPWPVNCPPGHAPACCNFPPPMPYGGGGGGYGPPNPFAPPSPYGYVPVEGRSCVTTSPNCFFSIILLLFLLVNNNYV